MIARLASGLVVVALAAGCKDKAEPPPRKAAPAPVRPADPVPMVVDAAIDAPTIDAPIDAGAALPDATTAERAMVAAAFARLNGTAKLEIKGVDVEPFRRKHLGYGINDNTSIKLAAVANGKRTFEVSKFVVAGEGARLTDGERVFMTFDAKKQLVGISY